MGDPISSAFSGSGKTSKQFNAQATQRAQNTSDAKAQNDFVQKYLSIFGGPMSNQNFQQSLSGYYNQTPFQTVAQNIAKNGAFQPVVKKQFTTSTDNGLLGNSLGPIARQANPMGSMSLF